MAFNVQCFFVAFTFHTQTTIRSYCTFTQVDETNNRSFGVHSNEELRNRSMIHLTSFARSIFDGAEISREIGKVEQTCQQLFPPDNNKTTPNPVQYINCKSLNRKPSKYSLALFPSSSLESQKMDSNSLEIEIRQIALHMPLKFQLASDFDDN